MTFFKLSSPLKEPDIKHYLEIGLNLSLEFREAVAENRASTAYFCLISTDNSTHILCSQKNRIRLFSARIALKWLKAIGYDRPIQFRSDLTPHKMEQAGNFPTCFQIRLAELREGIKRHQFQTDDMVEYLKEIPRLPAET